ncbi:MAG: hypothetical protein HIU85_10825 [Proteobacteria bacterium]|nr:hypothetical protein [Pseudomonadota bacterium]
MTNYFIMSAGSGLLPDPALLWEKSVVFSQSALGGRSSASLEGTASPFGGGAHSCA